MSDTLNKIVDNYVDTTEVWKSVSSDIADDKDKVLFIMSSAKDKLKSKVYEEIRIEIKSEIEKELEEKIKQKTEIKRLDAVRKLMIDGFLVAIFVGLFVNQITDFIGILKGSVNLESIGPTIILAIVFLFICIVIFSYIFISEAIKLVRKNG